VVGLSQAQVAELAGVSLNWYELFESGRDDRRVSIKFVKRVAQALRLDENDTLELFRLVRPISEAESLLENAGAVAALRALRQLAARVASASDNSEIAELAADTVQRTLRPDSSTLVTLKEHDRVGGFALGPRGDHANNATFRIHWNTLRDLPASRVGAIPGGPTIEELRLRPAALDVTAAGDDDIALDDLRLTPELYQDALWGIRVASSLSLPLIEAGATRGLIGACWTKPRSFSMVEVETAKAIAAVVQLVTT
jgi:transcriptional regulator with XRE-family HTH domain